MYQTRRLDQGLRAIGANIHLLVSFACDDNEGVAALARRVLVQMTDVAIGHPDPWPDRWRFEARHFLTSLAERTGRNPGPKGGLSLWGMTSKNINVDAFCEGLRPFWAALLSGIEGGPCAFERVIVFSEREQTQNADAYQIGWDDNERQDRNLVIKKCEHLPFSWGLY